MNSCVVNASIAAKWVVKEEGSETAQRLLLRPCRFVVPELYFAELSNILWKLVRRGDLSAIDAQVSLVALDRIEIETVPHQGLMHMALSIAIETGRTAYDSLYLALAIQRELPFVTADLRLYNALKDGVYGRHLLWMDKIP